jgi:hypothetical protein
MIIKASAEGTTFRLRHKLARWKKLQMPAEMLVFPK